MATQEDRIIKQFQRDNRTYHASEMAYFTGIPQKSVYSVLSRMVAKGLLFRPRPTLYQANPTIGVGTSPEPFRLQNFRLVASKMNGKKIEPPLDLEYLPKMGYVRELRLRGLGVTPEDEVNLRFQIGAKRGKLTFTIKAPLGLDLYGFQLSMAWLDRELHDHGFHGHVEWLVDRGTELLKDMPNIDMDSMRIATITRYDYEGFMEKIYQKKYGVRREIKIERPTKLESIEAVLMGGLPTGMLLNYGLRSLQNQEKAINVMKGQAGGTYEMQKMFDVFTQAMYGLIDKVGAIEMELKEMRENK